MKQSINLLRDDLKPINQRMTLNLTVVIALLLLLGMLAGLFYVGNIQQHSQQQLAEMETQLAQLQQRQEQLQQQLQARSPSKALVAQRQALEEAIVARQQLNEQLAQLQPTDSGSPDQLMQELYQVDIEGLWLTDFSMTPAGVSLVGKTIRANLLPRWMKRFQAMPLLSQSRFAVVDLDRNEQGQQTFALTNKANADATSDSAGDNP